MNGKQAGLDPFTPLERPYKRNQVVKIFKMALRVPPPILVRCLFASHESLLPLWFAAQNPDVLRLSASGLAFFAVVPSFGDEAVSDPGFCLDVLHSGFGFELLAQLAYEYAQILWLVRRLRSPDGG